MPKVSYHEFRPGRWVKMVDGQVVGPATAEEVAAWERERAEQARIWTDVVKQAAPVPPQAEPLPVVGPAQPLPEPPRVPDVGRAPREPAAKPPRAAPPADSGKPIRPVDEAQAAIWRDVVRRALGAEAVATATAEEPETAGGAEPQATATLEAATTHPAPAVEPTARPGIAAAETTSSHAVEPARPVPTARRASRTKPRVRAAEMAAPLPEKVRPLRKAARRGQIEPLAEETPRAEAEPQELPVVVEPQVEAESLPIQKYVEPEAELVEEAVTAEPEATPAAPREPLPSAGRRKAPGLPRQPAKRPFRPTAQPGPAPLYLWIMASAADDLATAVRTGLSRYQERFSRPAEVVLCHPEDVVALEGAGLPVDVREGKGMSPRNFWIGLK